MIRRFILALMAAALLLPQLSFGQELKVMSYNIRLGSGEDGTNSWQFRAPLTLEMLEDQAPDVFGVQEALKYQVDFIKEFTDDYECVGVGRDNGKKEELFRFFDNYGQNGIKINVEPHFEDLYK